MESVALRAATEDDIAGIEAVHRRAITTLGASHYTADEVASWAAGLDAAFYRRALRHTHCFEVAADAAGRVVAFAAARGDEVWLLYTDPDWTGRGIGTALLARAEQAIRERGHATVRVRASLNAEAFYARRGYRRLRIYGHPTRGGMRLAALAMEKGGEINAG